MNLCKIIFDCLFVLVLISMDKIEIRTLLRHYWKQAFRASAAAKKICQVEGEDVVSTRVAQMWFKKFNDGERDLQDRPRSGRPIKMNCERLRQSVEDKPSTSTRRLSDELDVSQRTVVRHLKAIGKVNRRCREVPHDLTENQAKRRIETCTKLLENPRDYRFLRQIVTSDEKWIYFSNPDKKNQWLDVGQVGEPVPKRERFSKKALLCVWWNFEGVIHFELIPNSRTLDADLYCAQLDRMYAKMQQKYPSLVNRKRVLLQQDNAKPHTAKKTLEKIEKMESIQILPHPAYSPDLAPSDYYLFRAMAHFLKGRTFNDLEEVEIGCQEFFVSKDKEWYQHGMEQLADRWVKTIEFDGLYFKN